MHYPSESWTSPAMLTLDELDSDIRILRELLAEPEHREAEQLWLRQERIAGWNRRLRYQIRAGLASDQRWIDTARANARS